MVIVGGWADPGGLLGDGKGRCRGSQLGGPGGTPRGWGAGLEGDEPTGTRFRRARAELGED